MGLLALVDLVIDMVLILLLIDKDLVVELHLMSVDQENALRSE